MKAKNTQTEVTTPLFTPAAAPVKTPAPKKTPTPKKVTAKTGATQTSYWAVTNPEGQVQLRSIRGSRDKSRNSFLSTNHNRNTWGVYSQRGYRSVRVNLSIV
jgi:hypothetical protein